jgi:hypothetical protein
MSRAPNVDGVLITWGDRLFYPGNRVVKVKPPPKMNGGSARQRAAAIRERITSTVVGRAPQVMDKVAGGGRGMQAITAHLRYISKNGRLDIEDELGETMRGREALQALTDDWRFGGTLIDDIPAPGQRREAFNLMLSMPRGTDPLIVQKAAREFAQTELADHKYVMVLHDHQANPHVHLSVRAESKHGKRLNPRKADLHRWRETFAEKLRGYGIDAEATRWATRGRSRNYDSLWRIKARKDGRLRTSRSNNPLGSEGRSTRADTVEAWMQIGRALVASGDQADQSLARSIAVFIQEMPGIVRASRTRFTAAPERSPGIAPAQKLVDFDLRR